MLRHPPPPPHPRSHSPPPPPPAYPPPASGAGGAAGLMGTSGKQSQPGANAAFAALANLRMGGAASGGAASVSGASSNSVSATTPANTAGAKAAGATHVRRTSRRQASQDLKDLKISAKAVKAQEKAHSKKIDLMLAEQEAKEKAVVKILLLGPGESGKSTLFKQIQKNYGTGFDATERKKHHIIVVQNVIRSIKSLLYHSERLLQRLPFSALSNVSKAATTSVSPQLAESKAFIEAVNLYKLFEGTSVKPDDQTDQGVPSPEISPRNGASRTNSVSRSVSSTSSSSSAAAAGGGGVDARGGRGSLIDMNPAALVYGGTPIVKLNPSGKFVPQVLTKGADGRAASDIFHELLTHAFLLWADPGLKCTFENRAHFDFHQLFDSDSYFLHKLATGVLLHPEYVPSDEDLIRVRIRTTAINSIDFKMRADDSDDDEEEEEEAPQAKPAPPPAKKGATPAAAAALPAKKPEANLIPMRLLDVAGQRSERKKWIPYFQDATAVIFVAGISEYDQVLAEDGTTNRLMEAIHLFTEIMNSEWFVRTPLVLFLNKCDLFAEKIRRVPLNILFPKYSGSSNYVSACEFLCREFVKRRANPNKVIHIHVVSAIQIDLIKTAMDSVKTMIIEQSLGMAGLMQ